MPSRTHRQDHWESQHIILWLEEVDDCYPNRAEEEAQKPPGQAAALRLADYVPHPDAGEADKEKEDFHKRDVSNQADAG